MEGTDCKQTEFTGLLGKLVYNKQEFFLSIKKKVNIRLTVVRNVYSNLIDFIQKPLTNDEVTLIIAGLETRRANMLEYRKAAGNESTFFSLKDLKFNKGNGVITERHADSAEYEFTRLLESLIEKPLIFPTNGYTLHKCIDPLIKDLITLRENLTLK